ncbi:ATP-binding protein [Lelliottia sp. T2.26D-8]|uniref:ATP-binding protein n=1 Tax=Lelliottia sp. T2.26D-8 TaxID=3041165 RepID=UPI0024777114|nr:ATP-binding protein [Lelliottia sp. T2.26D-8]CAI9401691.1 hypothetical protein CCAJJPOJ_00673 [Lelliottia sp. T2.26D-8]
MLDLNQCKSRDDLRTLQATLKGDLAFAVEHVIPWEYGNWARGEIVTSSCQKHGNYEPLTLKGKDMRQGEVLKSSRCPECIREELAKVDADLRALRVADLLDNAGIARRFANCEFDNYIAINDGAGKNLNACRRYSESWPQRLEQGTGVVMTGSCGTGKNHLAVSMTKAVIRNHLARVELTDVMRITRAVKSTWRNNSEHTEDDVLDHYASLDLLIIDEVGVQMGTASEMTILQEIINARYESVLPTILISNLTFEQLQASIGERIVDRVTDGGRNKLAFNWESYRSKSGVTA